MNSYDKEDKSYHRWRRMMELGAKTGCHQRPDRSLYFQGFQLPVCARCTGVILGYLASVPLFIMTGFQSLISFFGCMVIFLDWLLQRIKIKESNNTRRLITGFCGGFGIMSIQLYLIVRFLSLFRKK